MSSWDIYVTSISASKKGPLYHMIGVWFRDRSRTSTAMGRWGGCGGEFGPYFVLLSGPVFKADLSYVKLVSSVTCVFNNLSYEDLAKRTRTSTHVSTQFFDLRFVCPPTCFELRWLCSSSNWSQVICMREICDLRIRLATYTSSGFSNLRRLGSPFRQGLTQK